MVYSFYLKFFNPYSIKKSMTEKPNARIIGSIIYELAE